MVISVVLDSHLVINLELNNELSADQ